MTMLDTIQALGLAGGGAGVFVGAIGYAIRQGSAALARRAEAKATDAEAALKRAEAKRIEAESARIAASTEQASSFAHDEMIMATLRDYARRLDERDEVIARMQVRLDAQAAEIASLHRAIRRLGGTPTGLHAAASKEST